ncbi:MAG: hypothetical protein ABIR48_04545 [Gammaproteobacteria bacterium]
MVIQDFAVIILLFIFAEIIFYMVIMKGLLFKSITGRTPEEEALAAKEAAPLFSLELRHIPVAYSGQSRARERAVAGSSNSNLAEQMVDFPAIVRQELQHLNLENTRFVPPYKLRVGESKRVEMIVTQNIVASVTRSLNAAFPSNITSLKAEALMTVSLHAEGFMITPLAEPQQRLGAQAAVQWAWDITPLKTRGRTLGFDIVLNLKTASGDERRKYTWRNGHVEVAGNFYFTLKRFLKWRKR